MVSGDLTQRAKTSEFRDAARFLSLLPHPQIIVPGNHDVPLHNLAARWLTPLSRYRRFITNDLEPFFEDAEIAVLGVNTARAGTFKNGRINAGQVARARARFSACLPGTIRIVVTHHPFDFSDTGGEADVVGRAGAAMTAFAECGVDLILSGHLHDSAAGDSVARYGVARRPVVLVQAGTATSTRRRDEDNSFNYLSIEGGRIGVDCMSWDSARMGFTLSKADRFTRDGDTWRRSRQGDEGRRI